MNISNDTPPADPIEYITKQLPKDLVKLLEVRDELAKRQGAMAAVDAAIAKKVEADAYYETTKVTADKLRAETAEVNQQARDKKRKLDELDSALVKREADFEAKHLEKSKQLAAREKELTAATTKYEAQALDLAARELKLKASLAEHTERVEAFRAKVAQITA
jgi:hypothetical protein